MDDVFVYYIDLPGGVHEMVIPCADGYTVYIDNSLTREGKTEAYLHALHHIKRSDFENKTCSVNKKEMECHK